jgi:hypothetical protein
MFFIGEFQNIFGNVTEAKEGDSPPIVKPLKKKKKKTRVSL